MREGGVCPKCAQSRTRVAPDGRRARGWWAWYRAQGRGPDHGEDIRGQDCQRRGRQDLPEARSEEPHPAGNARRRRRGHGHPRQRQFD
ncbi:unnamed protein product, partial [Ectocarpus sp. 4 AP-2014]